MSTNFFPGSVCSIGECASHTTLTNSFIHWFLPLVRACETIAWFMQHFSISHDYDLCKYVFIAVAYIPYVACDFFILFFILMHAYPSIPQHPHLTLLAAPAIVNPRNTHNSDRNGFTHMRTQRRRGQMNVQFNFELTTARKKCNLVSTHSMQLADLEPNFDHAEFRSFSFWFQTQSVNSMYAF